MKKLVSILAVAAFMFSMNVSAQEPQEKEKKAKTEKSCSKDEKKGCAKGEKKGGCCAHKKAEDKKAE
jgi:Ni/Co efflux regulator RcnB